MWIGKGNRDRVTVPNVIKPTNRVVLWQNKCCGQPMVRITEERGRPYKSAREREN
jgi:hypothetical protein